MAGKRMMGRPAAWLEAGAAATLGCAVGFAAFRALQLQWTMTIAASFLVAAVTSAVALWLLEAIAAERHALPDFAVEPIPEPARDPSDLFLRLRDVLAEASAADQGGAELLLDDVLESPAGDSRVVQLFQGTPLPTAGELQARIDRHLDRPAAAMPDASDELFEALASLKRSLG